MSPHLPAALNLAEQVWSHWAGLGSPKHASVMVCFMPGWPIDERRTRRHLRLYRDQGGLYVRMGKRATFKKYLHDMGDARIADAELRIVTFFEVSK